MIEYEKYFRHFDSCEGEGEVDEEEEEKKESKMIDKKVKKEEKVDASKENPNMEDPDYYMFDEKYLDKLFKQTKCRICEKRVKFPFYLCTHENCQNLKTLFCDDCYLKWCGANLKSVGQCHKSKHLSSMNNKAFVQKYSELDPNVDKEVKSKVTEILKIELWPNILFYKSMYKYYKEFGKEDIKNEFIEAYNKFVNSKAEILIDRADLEVKLLK